VWPETVVEAVSDHSASLAGLVVLNAEVGWQAGKPRVVRVRLDYAALRASGKPVGLALRVGSYPGPFAPETEATDLLADLAASLLAESASNRLGVAELQIDFDCAESKLAGYRLWIEEIRRRVAPVPVTITVLPAWLGHREFRQLIDGTDGYVLQVHSVERPRNIDAPFTLCPPDAARRAVERAARLGRPFRVALPTYGYALAFDVRGEFIGLSAEGPAPRWPARTLVREVSAEPATLAELVLGWTRDRPAELAGIIWYRLPVAGDRLNWGWPTLAAVMAGSVPRPQLRTEARQVTNGLVELLLANVGQADDRSRVQILARWQDGSLIAADGLNGFEPGETAPHNARFASRDGSWRLAAGEERTVGWLRLTRSVPVELELKTTSLGP